MKISRNISAPRGSNITCKGWIQEAAMRMLMNNLDPQVAENPDQLIVYGGSGKAARNWQCYDAIISSLKNYGFYPLLYFATLYLINTKTKLKELAVTAGASVVLTIGFLIYGLAAGQGWGTEITPLTTEGSRLLDFDHAFYMSLAVIGAVAYILYGLKNKWRNFWILVIPVLAFGITASLMRHLWIAGGFATLFFIWLVVKDRSAQLKRLLLVYTVSGAIMTLAIFLVTGVLPNSALSQRFSEARNSLSARAFSLSSSDTSVSWRSSVWQSVWRDYQEQPVLGLGFGQKVFIDMPDYLDYVELRNVHNSFLAVFMQMGILSFLVLMAFGWKLWSSLIREAKGGLRPWNIAMATMLLFCAVAFLFQPYLEANFFNVIFWVLTGVSRRLYEGFTS